jgi:hypothetical protein
VHGHKNGESERHVDEGSSRVISMPRKRKPSSRGKASRFSGRPDAISSSLLLVLNSGGESDENLRRPEAVLLRYGSPIGTSLRYNSGAATLAAC